MMSPVERRTCASIAAILTVGLVFVAGCEPTDFSDVDLYGQTETQPEPPPDQVAPPADGDGQDQTNAPPATPAGGYQIASIGSEERCGSFEGDRPSIAVDSLDQPHAVVDRGSGNTLYIYHRIGNVWTELVLAKGSQGGTYNASRIYMPHVEIDKKDRAWISAKFGCKEYGSMSGQGLWCYENITTAPSKKFFKWVPSSVTHKGNGNIALDPNEPNAGYMLASGGRWAKINDSGNVVATGSWNVGPSGEKIRGEISPRTGQAGVWHSAMNGYDECSSSYQNSLRNAAGKDPVVWASYSKYPEQGIDTYHPGIGIDLVDPEVCYISATFNVGPVINVWNGEKFVWGASSLPVLESGGSAGIDRFGPQWAPTRDGGAYVSWTKSGRIKMQHVKSNGTMGGIVDVCAGRAASICTDSAGHLHMIYDNGGMCYRKITLK